MSDRPDDTLRSYLPRRARPAGASPPKIKLYDFRRPDKFSKEQIRTISTIHESFARRATARFTEVLRAVTEVHVTRVDQLTYQEFLDSAELPTTLVPIAMDPLKGASLLQIDSTLTAVIVDRMFGGPGGADPRCTYTDLECEAVNGLVGGLTEDLSDAWKPVTKAAFRSREIEKYKYMVAIVPPTEMIVLVAWEVTIGGVRHTMRLVIPYLVLEPILGKLSARAWYSSVRRGPAEAPPAGLADIAIDAEILFEAGSLSLADIVNLEPGTSIPLPDFASGVGVLRVGGKDVLPVRRTSEEGVFVSESSEPFRGRRVLSRILGDRSEPRSDEIAVAVNEAISAGLKPILADLRTELSRMAAQHASVADAALTADAPRSHSKAMGQSAGGAPFDFIRAADADSLSVLLRAQHPQIIAMVLAHLEPRTAAAVVAALSQPLRPIVIRRLATIGPVSPALIRTAEAHLAERLSGMGSWELQTHGGVDGASAVLNYTPKHVEAEVIGALDSEDPELSNRIKQSMFVFEDLVGLEGQDLQAVLAESEAEDLAIALKATSPDVRDRILSLLPDQERDDVKGSIASMGRLRLTDVDAAQRRIVETTRRLDLGGQIVVQRPD